MKENKETESVPNSNTSELLSRISYLENKINELEKADQKNAELRIRRRQKNLEKIIENLPVPLIVKNIRTGEYTVCNKAAETVYDIPHNEAIGKTDYDFFSKEQADSFKEKDKEVVESREVVRIGEQLIYSQVREEIIVNTIKIPIYDEKGEPESIVVFSEDITEKKKYEKEKESLYEDLFLSKVILEENSLNIMKLNEELISSEEKLKEALNTKNKFFTIIAHDLRSPIVGFLQLAKLLSEEINNISINDLGEISKTLYLSADKLYKLLENLLEWSFIQQSQIEIVPKRIRLLEVLNDVFQYLDQVAKNKNISIETNIEPDIYAFADQNMLDLIFRNLISNAVKFSNKGGKIIVNCDVSEKYEDKYLISVKDFGIGIDSNLAANLFRIDKRTQRVGTQGEDGSGLGLILTKEFITRHDEEIWVESSVGEGTTFYFTIKRFF